jgi:hypothetical protein
MIERDWFDWSNAGVSLFGLLLSGGAILQATGAKRAAEAARQAVFSRNALEDVGRLREIATNLLLAIETEQYGLANYRARDFISDAPRIRERHQTRLGKDGGKLESAVGLVRVLSIRLQAGEKKDVLLESAQRVLVALSSLEGTLKSHEQREGR